VLPLVDCAKSATACVAFATPLSTLKNWCIFAMNAITAATKAVAPSAAIRVSRMPFIVENAFNWKRIEMDVPKLSIWGPPKQICFMNAKNMALRKDDDDHGNDCLPPLQSTIPSHATITIHLRAFTMYAYCWV